ncbi:GntR family transcriptional regulator [Frankia sp. Ag45/Mut15]|uniref:GntR family transcriptional regulator n=1 Tax=Frankia umida TaxID=573489 RepID=A0ABT0K1I9_9ACTN|nr:GntR family transcriptional regulator [Frankia umida]MCK9877679.1 GntR family transcriptional regulator [Frankia umida]
MRVPRPPVTWVATLSTDWDGSAREAILGELKRVILDGAAGPGLPIPVDEVAARYQVSRIPVREALMSLVGEGLVEHRARAGYTVAALTPAELREFYLVREALEASALAAAVRRATAADDERVLAAHVATAAAIEAGDARGHHRESRRFHLALVNAGAMPRLARMYESAWNMTEPARPMDHAPRDVVTALNEDHERMLAAFAARNAPALLEISRLHHARLRASLPGSPGPTP